jgi:hypothetical protein
VIVHADHLDRAGIVDGYGWYRLARNYIPNLPIVFNLWANTTATFDMAINREPLSEEEKRDAHFDSAYVLHTNKNNGIISMDVAAGIVASSYPITYQMARELVDAQRKRKPIKLQFAAHPLVSGAVRNITESDVDLRTCSPEHHRFFALCSFAKKSEQVAAMGERAAEIVSYNITARKNHPDFPNFHIEIDASFFCYVFMITNDAYEQACRTIAAREVMNAARLKYELDIEAGKSGYEMTEELDDEDNDGAGDGGGDGNNNEDADDADDDVADDDDDDDVTMHVSVKKVKLDTEQVDEVNEDAF